MSTIPFNKERCKERLLREYKTHGNLLIAFDFDNTVFDYHNTGDDYSYTIDLLRTCQNIGMSLILFTVDNEPEKIKKKVDYLESKGIYPRYINESPLYKESVKPYYNILLDDRAGLEEACEILMFVLNSIRNEHN